MDLGYGIAWLAALGVFFAVTMPLWQPGQGLGAVVLVGAFGGLLMASTVAALTGILVSRFERRQSTALLSTGR